MPGPTGEANRARAEIRFRPPPDAPVPALQAERSVILAGNGPVVIEFSCRSASARRKISLKEPGILDNVG
jgi:hypothetical protein